VHFGISRDVANSVKIEIMQSVTGFDTTLVTSFGIEAIFYVLLLVFTIHALFLAYHWFSYGSSRSTSTLALAIYIGGGAVLFLIIGGSLLYL